MNSRVHTGPNLNYSLGTQVGALKAVQGSDGQVLKSSGSRHSISSS